MIENFQNRISSLRGDVYRLVQGRRLSYENIDSAKNKAKRSINWITTSNGMFRFWKWENRNRLYTKAYVERKVRTRLITQINKENASTAKKLIDTFECFIIHHLPGFAMVRLLVVDEYYVFLYPGPDDREVDKGDDILFYAESEILGNFMNNLFMQCWLRSVPIEKIIQNFI